MAANTKAKPKVSATQKKINQIRQNENLSKAQKSKQIAKVKAQAKAATPKPLNRQELSAKYGWAEAVLASNPEIAALFNQAVKGQWEPALFAARLASTTWYRSRSDAERKATTLELSDPASWAQQYNERRNNIRLKAKEIGGSLSEADIDRLARESLYNAWDEDTFQMTIGNAITAAESPGGLFGKAGEVEDQLRLTAGANGVTRDNEWYAKAARQILTGQMTVDDYDAEIRKEAASLYAPWADKILAGQNVKDQAAGYISMMGSVLEIPEGDVSLDDPLLKRALLDTGQDGEPALSPLWKFEQTLKADDRWLKTKNGSQKVSEGAGQLLKMWGAVN